MIPATFVVVNSHASEDQMRLVISEALREDMKAKWNEPSEFIKRLAHIPWIGAKTSWSDLDRSQLQSLIAVHISIRNEDHRDDELVISGLYSSLVALIVNLEEETGWVSMLRVNHLGPLTLEVDVSMTIGVKIETKQSLQSKPRFRVIEGRGGKDE